MQHLPIDSIVRRTDARALNDATVSSLADSIGMVGLINPIRVRPAGDRWEVVAGAHRLAACQRLGLVEIECIVVSDDDLHAELAMIDENLCRADLSPAERSAQTARRKVIYVELHPETAQHVAGAHASNAAQGNASANFAPAFTAATAEATGRSERTVQLDAERGEKVIPEVLEMIAGTKLDIGTYLDRIKNLPPNEQVFAAKRDLAELRRSQAEPKPAGRKRSPMNDIETYETWRDSFLRVWNRGSQEWRERIMDEVDTPVMDAA